VRLMAHLCSQTYYMGQLTGEQSSAGHARLSSKRLPSSS